jgi:hypothetical protein
MDERDFYVHTDWENGPPNDIDEDELEAELSELEEEIEAFQSAMERDTSVFLADSVCE